MSKTKVFSNGIGKWNKNYLVDYAIKMSILWEHWYFPLVFIIEVSLGCIIPFLVVWVVVEKAVASQAGLFLLPTSTWAFCRIAANSSSLRPESIHMVTSPTQSQLNSIVGFDTKMTLHHHQPPAPPPTPQPETQHQQYLSCYWSDFDETLNACSWEHQEHIPIVTVTFVQATFVLVTFVHIRNISAVTDPILTEL